MTASKCSFFLRTAGRGLSGFTLFAALCLLGGTGIWFLESAVYWVPCLTFLAAVAAVCCLGAGSWRWGAVACCCLAAHASLLCWAVMPWPRYAAPGHAVNLRVLTANVYEKQHDPEPVLALIRAENPDVVLLQEVDDAWQARLRPLETLYPHHHVCPRYSGGSSDLAVYWRGGGGAAAELAGIGIPGVAVDLMVNGAALRVVNVHTAAPFTAGRARRYRDQMSAVTCMAREEGRPLVIGGDLNSCPWSPQYRKLMRNGRLRSARHGLGLLGTWPSFFGPFRTPLDHILVSPGIEVVDCRVGRGIGSDHRPLIADLHVPPNTTDEPISVAPK